MKILRIEIFRSTKNNQWYFRITAKNGRFVTQSEGYKTLASARKTAGLIASNNVTWIVKVKQ